MADYRTTVFKEHTGYLVSMNLLKIPIKHYPDLIEKAWKVIKLVQDLIPGSMFDAGYGSEFCGLRIRCSEASVREVTRSRDVDLIPALTDYLGRNVVKLQAIAKFIEDKINE